LDLTSTSTPAGKSIFFNSEIVSSLCSRISINLACERRSKCSRDFLSVWGERKTQKRSILVGSGMAGDHGAGALGLGHDLGRRFVQHPVVK
jgi:hypothetical protein